MTVEKIIKAVRWCIDEEDSNPSSLANSLALGSDNTLMNNIIRYKIPAALRWVCLYAPSEQLSGVSSGGGGQSGIEIVQEDAALSASGNLLTPTKSLVRVVRVYGTGWHRAILGDTLIKEDSDEYLQVHDSNGAEATKDRPQAALVNTKVKKVEVFPVTSGDTFCLTYITSISATDIQNLDTDSTDVGIPDAVETSFIYYLAYLVLSAYGDARAKSMFEIATMNLGRSEDKQRQ